MADSEALRSQRKRAHGRGDHSLCRPGCGRGSGPVPPAPAVLAAVPGGFAGNLDPRRAMARLARRLEAVHEADPANVLAARALHDVLRTLAGDHRGPAARDEVDQIRAEWEALNGGV